MLFLKVSVRYLLSHFPPHAILNSLRTLLTKLLPITALVIYVSYLLNHFPPRTESST